MRVLCIVSQTCPERPRRRRRSKRLDPQAAAAVHPPPLDLGISIIAKLRAVLLAVRPLIRVPLRLDRLALELRRHCCAYRRVGQVEYLLVQAGRLLRNRRSRKPGYQRII